MGLLDDAIREHLELKRLRGADPGLVSREESEVFGPVRGGEQGSNEDEIGAQEGTAHEDDPPVEQTRAQSGGFPNVGQETVELDMRAVLDEPDKDAASSDAQPVAARPPSTDQAQGRTADDSLEWEMPGSADEGSREHREGDPIVGEDSGDEPVEDVLEETPDFLRDTPEQERLWFEQRPPRDFDFDK